MIKIDISNVWGSVEFADLMEIEKEVSAAHAALDVGTEEVKRYRGWRNLPARMTEAELSRMEETAARLRSQSEAVVVVGVGGASLGARAAIELLQGQNRNIGRGTKGNPQIFYAGNSLSTRQWNELCRILDDRDFSIAIVSKSGTATETAIATRALRWRLERKYGTDGARERIVAVTDPVQGALRQMANEEGWETFSIPPDVSGRFSVLSAAGLLPMAVAGVDIRRVLAGARTAKEEYDLRSYENPVWLYAAVRNLLYRHGKEIEIFSAFEPDFRGFSAWWRKLFGESEGKDGKGIFPATAVFTEELHSMGQLIQQGKRNLFETVLHFDPGRDRLLLHRRREGLGRHVRRPEPADGQTAGHADRLAAGTRLLPGEPAIHRLAPRRPRPVGMVRQPAVGQPDRQNPGTHRRQQGAGSGFQKMVYR